MNSAPPLPAQTAAPLCGDSADDADDMKRAALSALADGDAQSLDAACISWREDKDARRTWHAYHLIGDVMRSDELARHPTRDAAFLAALRDRLAKEPVVLAPSPVAAVDRFTSRSAWHVPVAMATGFVLVAGVLLVTRMGPAASPPAAVEMAAASASGDGFAVRPVSDRQVLIVDPRLQEFLRAHQAAGGSMAAAAPGGTLRRVEVIVPVTANR